MEQNSRGRPVSESTGLDLKSIDRQIQMQAKREAALFTALRWEQELNAERRGTAGRNGIAA